MNREPIFVVGYPKSGNTYTARLLAELLNSPVSPYKNAHPIASEGENRPGKYVVHQLHLTPVESECGEVVPNAHDFCYHQWNGEKVVLVLRDPRDVAVSAKFYWEIPSIAETLRKMEASEHPFKSHLGGYSEHISRWLDLPIDRATVYYERLVAQPRAQMLDVLLDLRIELPTLEHIERAILRQSFVNKRAQIQQDGEKRPYGKSIQLKNMRKGTAGDWKNHFSDADKQLAAKLFNDILLGLDYESDPEWWMKD